LIYLIWLDSNTKLFLAALNIAQRARIFKQINSPSSPLYLKGGNKYFPFLIEGAEIRIDMPFLKGRKMTKSPFDEEGI
jgi:hypothetical protein